MLRGVRGVRVHHWLNDPKNPFADNPGLADAVKMVEKNETERKKEKIIKRNEDNLRDLWDNVKLPERRQKERV